MIGKTMKRKFYSWLAEVSHKLSKWAVRRAYHRLQKKANAVVRYGSEAYRQIAIDFENESKQHDPMSLCRDYGIEQQRYYERAAGNDARSLSPSSQLFQCPQCGGPHFNVFLPDTLVCASFSKDDDIGCGWRGSISTMVLTNITKSPANLPSE